MTPTGVTWLGILVNVALAVVKVAVGVFARSQILLADGLHSVSDLLSDAAVLVGLRVSGRPADQDHHYGHRRVTTLVTMFVGAALLVTAIWIIYRAVVTYREPHALARAYLPFSVALVSIVPKELLFRVTRAIGLSAGDASVVANAWHHRTDAFTSVAAAAGLAAVAFGGPEWAFMDHLTAVVLSAFLVVAGVRFIHDSASELVDRAPAAAVVSCIEEAVSGTPGVQGFHALRVRRVGGALTLDVHVLVDPAISVVQGHEIAHDARVRVLNCGLEVLEAVVHVEPAEADGDSTKA